MAKIVKATFVKDPDRNRTVLLLPGEEPEPRLAALVTNPDAWEDGQPPAEATGSGDDSGDGKDDGAEAAAQTEPAEDTKKAAPAAKKTAARKTAATKPARGRDAADQGDSGD
ncbi:hypothetical protein [Streptomyces chartreusis]|uniref:hypothetical protein n=1 Tax=Streptomyces chartreusis TaxID=1969 RepID=UPI00365980F3